MSRAQQYYDNAARQRAYRERKRNASGRNVTADIVTRNVTLDDDDDYFPSLEELADQGACAEDAAEVIRCNFTPNNCIQIAMCLLKRPGVFDAPIPAQWMGYHFYDIAPSDDDRRWIDERYDDDEREAKLHRWARRIYYSRDGDVINRWYGKPQHEYGKTTDLPPIPGRVTFDET